MEFRFDTIILLLIFIILVVVIFQTIKNSLKFDETTSLILSVCISALATISLNSNLRGILGVILVPYAALAICIILVILIAFLSNFKKKTKDIFESKFKKDQHSTSKPRVTMKDQSFADYSNEILKHCQKK